METEPEITDEPKDKKFQATISKLIAVVGGKQNLKIPKKTPKDDLGDIVSSLFQEERQALLNSTKEELKTILKKYAEMEKLFSDKRKELEKLEKEKKEEFCKAANTLFDKIEDVGEIEKSYYDALKLTAK